MSLSFLGTLILTACLQTSVDRNRAENLARAGRTVEAFELFKQIVDASPSDVEARVWLGRLALRLGRTDEADKWFRSVLRDHPADVEARIGLGTVLTRTGHWRDALRVLTEVERQAGQNADLLGALARAYRRGGDDQRALEYFERARALSPNDPDLVSGYEAVARTYSHRIAIDGFSQTGAPGANAGSGTIVGDVRTMPRLHLEAMARVQEGSDYTDTSAGGGLVWRAPGDTTVTFTAIGGSTNTALANSDLSADVVNHAGVIELGADVRRLVFTGADVSAGSALFAWHPNDLWRLEARYTYSLTSFKATGQSSGDNSVLLREIWQAWRRAALQGSYAQGIESFEDLTSDRLGALSATTVAGGLRVDLPSLTRITATWEYQWRSNDTRINRITVSMVQFIR